MGTSIASLFNLAAMMRQSLFQNYQIEHSRSSWYLQVVSYIESCHLDDGGYFFARILPSSPLDTYFAVKSLKILNTEPQRSHAIVSYFLSRLKDHSLDNLRGISLAAEVLSELKYPVDDLKTRVPKVLSLQSKDGGFGTVKNLYVEASSELETTYEAVRTLRVLGGEFNERGVASFVLGLLNPDGGFGTQGHSHLATTFYATEILKLLGFEIQKLVVSENYLRKRESKWQVNFIEDMFWLVKALSNLGEKTNVAGKVAEFVMDCHRDNGGFARATVIGIPTLEYTFYAISILREIGLL